ncbi:GNAT family N-acetyltransferase [Miniphocaeibacter massiliensis]|uniref:GNAT family N-acetyltransferase n=1 Tax=Miniphocaeibacter massiliensis TaxID=2041841 RepID=UPI000C081208|nr:GNAT family N-acetyltransferase [Miniphocaeibacter massiliensis]
MINFRKMKKKDIPRLYNIAKRAFQPDYEKYGVYPPLLKTKNETFFPPLMFGKVILVDDEEIGGVFVAAIGKKGEIGAIFIDPKYQHKGYGKKVMSMIEKEYPKVKKWKLDTPSENYHLHSFYESLGYIKVGELEDKKSGMIGYIYEKNI